MRISFPWTGRRRGFEPSDFGYRIQINTTGKHVTINIHLNTAAAKTFGSADLSLTKGGMTVVETTLGLDRDANKGGRISLKFDPQSIDGGELNAYGELTSGEVC